VPQEVDDVFIDEGLTIEILNRLHKKRLQEQADAEVPLAEELPVAEQLYTEALEHAHEVMADARKGKDVDYREAQPLVDSFIESVFRNESAVATLFKLKKFDEYSYTHCINVGVLAIILGKYLGMDKDSLRLLGLSGLFHDVGKARIPEEILNKPAKLTNRETEIIKTHPLESYRIISSTAGPSKEILRGALEHHERYDGTGYPRGLSGDAISTFGRIISIVDVYDALTSKRVYKEAMPTAKALSMMYQWRDSTFAPNSIERFIKCIGVYPIGSFVRLTNGDYAIVVAHNESNAAKPQVKVVFDSRMRHKDSIVVDLLNTASHAGLDILECLDPAGYRVDLSRYLMA
jgi:HD-GYP domain-containing protein (c-di-GMP phosphodiesterase class II)